MTSRSTIAALVGALLASFRSLRKSSSTIVELAGVLLIAVPIGFLFGWEWACIGIGAYTVAVTTLSGAGK